MIIHVRKSAEIKNHLNKIVSDNLVYNGLEEKISEAISLCKTNDFVNLYIKLGDKLIFQLSRSSMIYNYLNDLNIGLEIESMDGIGIVNIIGENEQVYLNRLLDLEESMLFYQSSETDNSFFAIDFGKDSKGAAVLCSLLLSKVYRINQKSKLTFEIESWNEEVVQETTKSKGKCYIATSVMGDYDHPVVQDLRLFRDNWLLKREWGKKFTNWYYNYGPVAANFIDKSFILKKITYLIIVKPLQLFIRRFFI